MSKLTENTAKIQDLLNDISALPKDRYEEGLAKGTSLVKSIVERSFTEITAEDLAGITAIGKSAFRDAQSLKKIVISSSIKTIADYAFYGCSNIGTIDFLQGELTTIGSNAFAYILNVQHISIPNSVASIGTYAFSYCESLKSITLPNNSKFVILRNGTFVGCKGLKSITIPDTVSTIESNMFSNCQNLANVKLPSNIKALSMNMFSNCTGLTSITIPNSVTGIGSNTFNGCTGLMEVIVEAVTPPRIQANTFNNVPADCDFYVPLGSVEAYKSATNWSAYADQIFAIEE